MWIIQDLGGGILEGLEFTCFEIGTTPNTLRFSRDDVIMYMTFANEEDMRAASQQITKAILTGNKFAISRSELVRQIGDNIDTPPVCEPKDTIENAKELLWLNPNIWL